MSALLLVDIQYDFLPPNGSLAVSSGDEIISHIHTLLNNPKFTLIVTSQDWHPSDHISFASVHSLPPFQAIQLQPRANCPATASTQMLWPDHCVQNSHGAEIEESIEKVLAQKQIEGKKIIRVKKGTNREVDAYSAFDGTDLSAQLKEHNIKNLFVVGLATDYCVRASALSGVNNDLDVYVIREAVRGVDGETSTNAIKEMEGAKVKFIAMDEVNSCI